MEQQRIVVIGAGIGGLVAALLLAAQGRDVTLRRERSRHPAARCARSRSAVAALDAGPTVMTMRWVFDRIFASVGESLDDASRA